MANEYNSRWNYPHCLGSMDGRHIEIHAPPRSGSDYFNYMGYFSIVLLGLVDANYCFLYANVGCQGRISDGGVFANSVLRQMIDESLLNIPAPSHLPGRIAETPYVFICDDAFPLSTHIMKPFPGTHERNTLERIFNFRICRARRVVENTFGILVAVFRVLAKPLHLDQKKAIKVTLACIHLHNFLKKSASSRHIYSPPGMLDTVDPATGTIIDGQWRNMVPCEGNGALIPLQRIPRRAPDDAYDIRREFGRYFQTRQGRIDRQGIVE